nr:CobL=precorrin-6y-dependent methyltransferase [Pseudomonas denitrificans, Peptide Partial, 7 aa] [Pseudomonas denitrificans (nom. rej.)]
ADVSNSE